MNEGVERIFAMLDEKGFDIRVIRAEIAFLIAECIEEHRNNLGYWEKMWLASAISNLAFNRALRVESTAWLRLCLASLEKLRVPPEQRDEDYAPRYRNIDELSYQQLHIALQDAQG